MLVRDPQTLVLDDLDERVAELPNTHAVFLVWAGERSAYLAKTGMLRRRLQRILRPAESLKRSLKLGGVATRVDYWLTGSRFESTLTHYSVAKEHFPEDYLKLTRLRMPFYVRLVLANEFPRSQVTSRIGGSRNLHYGPFRTRAAAELFETQMLDLFQMRRCQENLEPRPGHPGCIYGEMNMCLRPCQAVVGVEEYSSEAARVSEFLTSNGTELLATVASARERLSEEMNFEEAARQHKRYERITEVLALRDELACDIDRLNGVAITTSSDPDAVMLWFSCQGSWQAPREFPLTSHISMDHRLQELASSLTPEPVSAQSRQEHLALLARWFYSTWRDGEWLAFPSLDRVPYRKLVRAVSRVHQASRPPG